MHLLFAFVLFTSAKADSLRTFTSAQEIINCSIAGIIPELNSAFDKLKFGDMIIFDLDNTLYRETQMLGTDEWWSHAIQQLAAEGYGEREAAIYLSGINARIKAKSKMRMMESCLPQLIKSLQDRGVWIIGLTARHPNLAGSTIERLHELGVHLENSPRFVNFPDSFKPLPNHQFLWRGNIAFTDGSPKGPIAVAMMRSTTYRPSRAMIFDDRIDHIYTLAEALRELRIPGQVVHYLKSQEEIFEPEIADVQLKHFLQTDETLSDRRARRRLDCVAALKRPAS